MTKTTDTIARLERKRHSIEEQILAAAVRVYGDFGWNFGKQIVGCRIFATEQLAGGTSAYHEVYAHTLDTMLAALTAQKGETPCKSPAR